LRLRTFLKYTLTNALHSFGMLESNLKRKARGSALILAYHRVNNEDYIKNSVLKQPLYVSDRVFDIHLSWLAANFTMVPLNDIIEKIRKMESWEEALCAITFDDGWHDNYEFALPLLKKHDVPSTIFVVGSEIGLSEPNCWDICFEIIQRKVQLPQNLTGMSKLDEILCLDAKNRVEKARAAVNIMRTLGMEDFDSVREGLREYFYNEIREAGEIKNNYKKLSWANMKEMQSFKVEFGYHSLSHPILINFPRERLLVELDLPSEIARQHDVKLANIFSYPDGKYNEEVVKVLKEKGYGGATSLVNGLNSLKTQAFELKRFNIHSGSSGSLPLFLYNLARKV
jgi:peptidoglycan/xylan/chitin deacetylase (PgdA/CDA1 family)